MKVDRLREYEMTQHELEELAGEVELFHLNLDRLEVMLARCVEPSVKTEYSGNRLCIVVPDYFDRMSDGMMRGLLDSLVTHAETNSDLVLEPEATDYIRNLWRTGYAMRYLDRKLGNLGRMVMPMDPDQRMLRELLLGAPWLDGLEVETVTLRLVEPAGDKTVTVPTANAEALVASDRRFRAVAVDRRAFFGMASQWHEPVAGALMMAALGVDREETDRRLRLLAESRGITPGLCTEEFVRGVEWKWGQELYRICPER